jgi:hypothetical protein
MSLELKKILDIHSELNINEVFEYFTKTNDILLLKYDGVRATDKYTVIIIGNNNRFETIRQECNSIEQGLRIVLNEYVDIQDKSNL